MSQFAVKWVYVLAEDYLYNVRSHLPNEFPTGCAFVDNDDRRRLEIHPDGTLKVLAEYAWDGCTPKFALWDILLGTPDGVTHAETKKPKTYYASLVHDVLYQFLDLGVPISRRGADRIFLELLTRNHFAPRWIYFAAVRVFGGLFRLFTRWKRDYRGKMVPL